MVQKAVRQEAVVMSRVWAMPSPQTFSIPPIAEFISRWLVGRSVDPFARDSTLADVTNDLNPDTAAQYHMEAVEFCRFLAERGEVFDTVIFDPPYSPRQISECYQAVGKPVGVKETQNGRLYKSVRDGLDAILKPGELRSRLAGTRVASGSHVAIRWRKSCSLPMGARITIPSVLRSGSTPGSKRHCSRLERSKDANGWESLFRGWRFRPGL